MSAIAGIFLTGLAASVAAYALSTRALLRLRRRARGHPLPGLVPAVSILKPLRGVDEELEQNLESFFLLDYDDYEIVFSFATRTDPAYPVARSVADRHPGVPATFVFDEREPGGNAKVNRLEAAMRRARHRLLLISDGNVRVRSDFLRRAAGWFSDSSVGLVSNLFRATGAVSLGSRMESLYLNGCLKPGTAGIARILRMPCVVGKSILVSRDALDAIGGFGVLRHFLAEDYLLGRAVDAAGYRVVLSGDVIDTLEVGKTLRAAWDRHRRWAMMRRRLAGPLYAGELLTGGAGWCAAVLATGNATLSAIAGLLLFSRYALEIWAARREGAPVPIRDWALLPARDLAAGLVFLAGLCGSAISWRGRGLKIGRRTLILDRAA